MFAESAGLPFAALCSPEIRTTQHIISFHDTLQENREVESVPGSVQCQTEVIAWRVISDDLHVPMIVERIGSAVYTIFTIGIGIHDIARSPACSPVRRTAVGKMFVHLFLTLCDPDRLVSPDIPQDLSFIIRTQGHCFIRIPEYLTQVVGYYQTNAIVEFLDTVSP